jgi:hypothetical protein
MPLAPTIRTVVLLRVAIVTTKSTKCLFFEKTGSAASPDIDLLFLGTGRFVGNPHLTHLNSNRTSS